MEHLLSKIKSFRKERGFSQQYMAAKLGIDYSTYGKMERGKISITVQRLLELSQILEVPINALCNLSDKNIPEPIQTDVVHKINLLCTKHRLKDEARTEIINIIKQAKNYARPK